MDNEQVKATIAVLDGSDPGFWGLGPGEHVVIIDTLLVHLNADNKVVGIELTNSRGDITAELAIEDGTLATMTRGAFLPVKLKQG
jgi:hypothetical protein